jgi:hypothetical protein
MPRHTHPAPRHRHDRAHIRFHRDRWVRKRGRQFRRVSANPARRRPSEAEKLAGSWGVHDDEQMWLGCHRANCGLCGYLEVDGDRTRRERLAMKVELEASDLS